jgi:hypothetical protein
MKSIIEYLNESESFRTLDDFYRENNIDEDQLRWLGAGDFGDAYSTGDGRVVKFTSSKNEFDIARELEGKTTKSFAKIYKTDIVGGQMIIVLEELDLDDHILDLFYELQGYCNDQGLPIQYFDNLDMDEIEFSSELQRFADDLDDIIRGYRNLGIEASDIRPENMGVDKTGKIKAFDIDDKSRRS